MITPVFCYRNLRRKGVVWSVRDVKTGLVLERVGFIMLDKPELKVSQAGRKRVLKEQRKNVHAGVRGIPVSYAAHWFKPRGWRRVEYNPYLYAGFVYSRTKKPVGKIRRAVLTQTGCYVQASR